MAAVSGLVFPVERDPTVAGRCSLLSRATRALKARSLARCCSPPRRQAPPQRLEPMPELPHYRESGWAAATSPRRQDHGAVAANAYHAGVPASRGRDDCADEYADLDLAAARFEAVVRDYEKACQ